MTLSAKAVATFAAVADTLLPAVEGDGPAWRKTASELGIPGRLTDLYDILPHDHARRDARLMLAILDSPVGGLALHGRPKRFSAMSPLERVDTLRRMARSKSVNSRQAFKALKVLAGYLFTSDFPSGGRPASWDAIGYPGPDGPAPEVPKPITPVSVDRDETLSCDVVVVGSGAGGGVAAAVLAAAGLDVIVLEKGGYKNEADYNHVETDAYREMYLDNALGATVDSGIGMLAGATLGGGTVVNYSTSFATPKRVREEWDRLAGFNDVFEGPDYEDSSAAVLRRLGVTAENNVPSLRDQVLEKGLRNLGWHGAQLPRNAVSCDPGQCGYCTLGCRTGSKHSTLITFLQDAFNDGARIVIGADVRKVRTASGQAIGVVAEVGRHKLTVRSRAVVLAAGSLNTPAILKRSGLGGKAVGHELRLHPVTAVWGRFREPIEPWSGMLQTVYSNEFADLDSEGYGFKFETAPIHPLFPAAFLGWDSGADYKRDVLGLKHLSPVGILLRDREGGRVKTRLNGAPTWHYRLSEYDTVHMREGVKRAAELLAAAGAEEVIASTQRPVRWRPGISGSPEDFMADVDSVGFGPNQTTYLSFHQMASARMGSNPAASVVGPENETHGTKGLFVMDASCFPTSSGVNPMVSIETIAHRGARALAAAIT